jgi:UDP-N-acetylmuramate--alanine ligase
MSSLALVMAGRGMAVSGSDRDHDRGRNAELFRWLQAAGVQLVPQDGSGVRNGKLDAVVVSGAVESQVADVAAARQAGIVVRRRAEVLVQLLRRGRHVAVAGTSGKSTVTAMAAWILRQAGASPTFLGGAPLAAGSAQEPGPGCAPGPGAWIGASDLTVAEADESDGTLVLYAPDVGVVTNLSEDHSSLEELKQQFSSFAAAVKTCLVMHADPARRAGWDPPGGTRSRTFGMSSDAHVRAEHLELTADGSRFRIGHSWVHLHVPGRFNVENALAAVAVARVMEVPLAAACRALDDFPGLSRRMERVGQVGGITVMDDFAHNPDKVTSALQALKEGGRRLRVAFQLHGFGPARMHRHGLVAAFAAGLEPADRLYMLPIYYAGGTVIRDVSADDYVADLQAAGVDALSAEASDALPGRLAADSTVGDTIVIMGARNPGLPVLARQVVAELEARG